MELFLIYFITCLAGLNSFSMGDSPDLESLEMKTVIKCAQELNVSADKYLNNNNESGEIFQVHGENADEETTCMAACSIRNIISERLGPELTGSDNKETLYSLFLRLIDESFVTGFGDEPTGYSHEDIVNKVKTCHAQESTECKFFQCVEIYKPPINLVATYYFVNNFLQLAGRD